MKSISDLVKKLSFYFKMVIVQERTEHEMKYIYCASSCHTDSNTPPLHALNKIKWSPHPTNNACFPLYEGFTWSYKAAAGGQVRVEIVKVGPSSCLEGCQQPL